MSNKNKVFCFSCRGCNSTECKDAIYYKQDDKIGFFGMGDGLNSKEYSRIGATNVQKALAEEIWKSQDWYFGAGLEEIKQNVIKNIKESLDELGKEKNNRDEYASTMMAVVLNKKEGIYRWFHIGDGLMLMEREDGELEIISHPQNGITRQYTFTTTNKNLKRYLHVGEGSLENVKRFLVGTDGATLPYYKERRLTNRGKQLWSIGVDAFLEDLKRQNPMDDYSMMEIYV